MKTPIYLDYAATTPVLPEVLEEMLPFFSDRFANASSSVHRPGREAAKAVAKAADQLADLLNVDSTEITFTSGSTEALNLVIQGVATRYRSYRNRIVTCQTEHKAVLDTCEAMRRSGFDVELLPVDQHGRLSVDELTKTLSGDVALCAVMLGNNETGVLHDLPRIGDVCRQAGVLLLVDATQAVGKMDCHPATLKADFLACSAHKFGGPKGIGALWINSANPAAQLAPLLHGGGHQGGVRPGTLNVPAIVGMGKAAAIAQERLRQAAISEQTSAWTSARLRDYFESKLHRCCPDVHINGGVASRLPHISNVRVTGIRSTALLARLQDRLALSTGSACSTDAPEPSHVLSAMSLTAEEVAASFRVSLGLETSASDLDQAVAWISSEVEMLRAESPMWQL